MGNALEKSATATRHRKSNHLGQAALAAAVIALVAAGCAKDTTGSASPGYCAPTNLGQNTLNTGSARVFSPDPMVSSGNAMLAPTAGNLDSFAKNVSLQNLTGRGVLQGKYVDVRNGDACAAGYGAYDVNNAFVYAHGDPRFQEAMAYYWGDQYRTMLDAAKYLQPSGSVQIFAHCQAQENAYFYKGTDNSGASIERVCLGYSAATQGAYYADDATVTVHELQHATTTDNYSPGTNGHLNQLWFDEAGALNEAISDFMSLVYEQPFLGAAFDPKLFSRWALGTFVPGRTGTRGAHKCPTYDPTYPTCGSFPAFSAIANTISYVYPDGVGWPYANNFQGPGYAANAFSTYKSQEEIHNSGVLLEGALWDVYDALKTNHGGDAGQAELLSTQLLLESVKHLPQQNLVTSPPARSPVSFRSLATQMSTYAPHIAGMSVADQTSVNAALTARGLLGGTQLDASWVSVGPGNSSITPGIRVQDNPTQLKTWLISMFEDPAAATLVPQTIDTGLNSKLDPGELVAIWFDLQDVEATTAGDVQVTATALDPQVTFDEQTNIGWVSPTQSQMIYGKVNGTSIVTALTSANATYSVGTGNSYFRTDPFFDHSYTTALWVRVSSTATHGSTVRFQVQALPSNGVASTATFTATIN